MAKMWNLKIFKHIRAQADEASLMLAQERGACPRRRRSGGDGALFVQDGDRADRVDLDHRRWHLGLHRADPGQYLHPTRPLSGSTSIRNPHLRAAAHREEQEFGRDLVDDPRARRLGPASRFPHARGKGRVQDQLRDRPALADRSSPPTARRSSTRRRRSTCSSRPTSTNGDLLMLHYRAWELGIKSLIICARRASSARASPAASRPTTRRTSGRSSCKRPTMTSVWPASDRGLKELS